MTKLHQTNLVEAGKMTSIELNHTHDNAAKSFVESANSSSSDFPIQNLPFGTFFRSGDTKAHIGMAIGDHVLDLKVLVENNHFDGLNEKVRIALLSENMNLLMELGNGAASSVRRRAFELLNVSNDTRPESLSQALIPIADVNLVVPANVRNFTDFLNSSFHSKRLNATGHLAPSFMNMPIAYHGRASSVCISGTPYKRPVGQFLVDEVVTFDACRELDYELELGLFIGSNNPLGSSVSIEKAADHLFGVCLLNDWSARDIQRWESLLGPFLSKSSGTTISPWIVTEEALRPFRIPAFIRDEEDMQPLSHLISEHDQKYGGIDIDLQATLTTTKMKRDGDAAFVLSDTNLLHCYWTTSQILTHHMSNGCNLLAGDLLGTGTISGPTDASMGCIAEINRKGTRSFTLPNGEVRTWIEDGDELTITGKAKRDGFASVGFGICTAEVEPAGT